VATAALPPVLASLLNPGAAAYLVPGAAIAAIAAVIALWPEGRRTGP
jgi:hypothetical protein